MSKPENVETENKERFCSSFGGTSLSDFDIFSFDKIGSFLENDVQQTHGLGTNYIA